MEVPVAKACKNIEQAKVYKPAPTRRMAVYAIALALYAIVLPYAYQTAGEPRRRAILEAEAIEAKSLADEEAFIEADDSEVVLSWDDDEEGGEQDGSFEIDLSATPDDDIVVPDDDLSGGGAKKKRRRRRRKKRANATGDGEAEFEDGEEDDDDDDDEEEEEEERPLPSPYLPDAGAAAALFSLVTLTALFNLLCHWFVWFLAWVYYEPTDKVTEGSYIHVIPYAHRGKPELVKVVKDNKTNNLLFEFQRQKFELDEKGLPVENVKLMGISNERVDHDDEDLLIQKMTPEERKRVEEKTKNAIEKLGTFEPVICKVDMPLETYIKSRGHQTKKAVQDSQARFGINTLQVEMKTMPDLVKEQMLSPLAMFQLFSAALWLMDEYWQYTIFNLFSIVMMESMTAFQRFRTLKTLKGLAPKPYELPVYRHGEWIQCKTTDLLPGDLISLSSSAHVVAVDPNAKNADANKIAAAAAAKAAKAGTDAVPCDCLILHGSAVVNEATLTGESVPQMKDALKKTSHTDNSVPLDVQGRDRVHVMFSGTTLISATPGEKADKSFPTPPDGGCLCYVLRTGFGSSQGELMQMIEFSTEQVSADSKETGIALLVLLFFAICSAAYVFKRGMEKGDRTTHELLLKCVIILTSVVPRQLPVQMALAVNHALMTLMREGIFCTEPYRVPYAGKITHCLFDKTGTLTTDELVPVGVVNASQKDVKITSTSSARDILVPVKEASLEATAVLAACHSLVAMPQVGPQTDVPKAIQLLGDPIELAAMRGVQWSFDPKTQLAKPGDLQTLETALQAVQVKTSNRKKQIKDEAKLAGRELDAQKLAQACEKDSTISSLQQQKFKLEKSIQETKTIMSNSPIKAIKIVQRYHFSSKLQRMSVVCQQQRGASLDGTYYCFVKGSPEAVEKLLDPENVPEWYSTAYRTLAEQGMRVLALGQKVCPSNTNVQTMSRDEAEKGLSFVGFIAFECKTRADSAMVIRSLRESDHRVAMLTGDAPLTALHVAQVTNICGDEQRKGNPPLLLSKLGDGESVEWVGAVGPQEDLVHIPFDAEKVPDLAEKHDLLTTEDALLVAVSQSQGKLWKYVDRIQVFARMSPQGKAKVIRMIQQFQETASNIETESFVPSKQTKFVLMCGDGGNDVGALKQADVGMALLSGYGNANTSDGVDSEAANKAAASGQAAEDVLNQQMNELKIKQKAAQKEMKKEFEAKKKEIMGKQRVLMEQEIQAANARGESGVWVQFNAVKVVTARLRAELQQENVKLQRKYNIELSKKDGDPAATDPTELAMEALDDPNGVPVVRPGDASVAAPFTSRVPSVRACLQLARQGRCTLLSALQQQKIMMLECTISAYCLAALSLEGARSSERQMMLSSWVIMTASLAFSYSTPIEKMHKVRPLRSLFHPAVFISILGQAAIHLFCMVTAVNLAKEAMGPEKLQEVIDFNRRVAKGLEKKMAEEAEGLDAIAEVMMMWSQPFMPNLMNTTIFLVETMQIMAVLFVNYVGRPWMLGLLENSALFLSLFIAIAGLIFAAWEFSPEINKLAHLHPFPDDEFRYKIMGLVSMTLVGTFAWDRFVTALFAPGIFRAMIEQAFSTRPSDFIPLFKSMIKVGLGFVVFASGNPIVWFGAWWLYKKYQSGQEDREFAALQAMEKKRKAQITDDKKNN